MKKIAFILVILLSALSVGCNKSNDGNNVSETRLTLRIEPKLHTVGGSISQIKNYYQARVQGTTDTFYIPVGDILGFDYKENYTYLIVVICTQNYVGGVPTGEAWYRLESILSKEYTPDSDVPVRPIEPN